MDSKKSISDLVLTGELDERTPEEETLVMRLRVFNNMRWFAILGIIIAKWMKTLHDCAN